MGVSLVQVEHLLVVVQFACFRQHLRCLHGHLLLFVHLDLVRKLLCVQFLQRDFALLSLPSLILVVSLEVYLVLEGSGAESVANSFFFVHKSWSVLLGLVVCEGVFVDRLGAKASCRNEF